ncbi:MAG: TIGR04282 family arsenosugar biosynthesis glycosyltransferase [Betaproteobacteria bacterium]|nr:TIGR04282 family arsenosugar biosynthesis glycosyltransferase [Betaproteobacteria bacterium]
MASETLVAVFAKAPVPGAVKTRLIPALGAEGAALLHAALTERVLTTAVASGMDVLLCAAPDTDHAFFRVCAEDFEVPLAGQLADADLGARMLQALEAGLQRYRHVIIVGADCPALTAKHLRSAAGHLASHDVVITPADDGGYVLIGATSTRANMFDGIEWGGADVLTRQRDALRRAGLDWHEMETLWDVDRPEDLARLQALKPALEFFWPA